jgi:glucose uptake protein GlcU
VWLTWLFPLSLGFVVVGIIVSVLEEWKKSGLTDTSFVTLLCWVIGLSGIGYWGFVVQQQQVAIVAFLPVALFLYWIALKLRDRRTHR